MTLRARLALGFLTVALLLAVPLATSLLALRSAKQAAERLRDEQFAQSLLLSRVRGQVDLVRRAETSVGVRPGDAASAAYFHESTRALRAYADSLRAHHVDALATFVDSTGVSIDRFGGVEIAAFADGQTAMAERVSEMQIAPAVQGAQARIGQEEQRLRDATHATVDAAATEATRAETIAGVLLALALVAGAAVAYSTTRSISRPVADLDRGMRAVAGGDFAHRLAVAPGRSDEFGRLAASYASMAEQLAELDKLKAEFVSVASHELKTPINVIMGYLKLLEEDLYGPLGEKQAEVVGTMQRQAASLGRLVQHLLDVSRFQAGGAPLARGPVSLRSFLQQIQTAHEVLAMQRDVTFAVTMSDTLPDVVNWDADRMAEVFGNLLTNAVKFTKAGGRVDLIVSSLEDGIYIAVRDTGVGIDAAQLPHVFDKFFQASNQDAASAKGSGLGLAIAKEIVEAHGGTIAVESTVGQGTTFSIVVPPDVPGSGGQAPIRRSGIERRAEAHAIS